MVKKKRKENLHDLLWSLTEKMPLDYEDYGKTKRVGMTCDCSCGCKWFRELKDAPADWGVCTNKKSHRAGKLTFEHQGCPNFEAEDD